MKKAILLFLLLALPFIALAAGPSKTLLRKDVINPVVGSFGVCRITDDGKVTVKGDSTSYVKSGTVDVARIQNLIQSLPSADAAYTKTKLADVGDRRPQVRIAAVRGSQVIALSAQSCINGPNKSCSEESQFIKNTSTQSEELVQIVNKACR